ncbi:hypothetical protein RND71_025718 [Anisodus tanguticus]|uniref:Uncharacterized protein n=1 Tax=Anisodus tanguticus TaxID=243964 RepID=A0AAE1RLV3_9SOLA|nr:hypothetical protein RND71_025718 [Anisodus tanguticus]
MIIGRAVRNRSLRAKLSELRWISVCTEAQVNGKRVAALWGNGDYGRLGHGNLESRWTPNALLSSAFDNQSLREIACGGAHTLFLTGVLLAAAPSLSCSQGVFPAVPNGPVVAEEVSLPSC